MNAHHVPYKWKVTERVKGYIRAVILLHTDVQDINFDAAKKAAKHFDSPVEVRG